jgi:hypothetical protein
MQNSASSPPLLEHSSHGSGISEADYVPGSKPTTATTGKRRVSYHQPAFRPDLTVSARTTKRHNKKYNYAPPASGRESWWRVTIKVELE